MKSMKLAFNLFLLALFANVDASFSVTDYEIKNICKKERKESSCIKNLKEKRFNLQKGNFIEIPVLPYRR